MTSFWAAVSQFWDGSIWSGWVMAIVVINYGSILFLFLWAPWAKIPTAEDGTTGHVWANGKIREGLHRLPVWWLVISSAAFIIAFIYLILYPGFGSHKGLLGWSSMKQLHQHLDINHEKMAPLWDSIENTSVLKLSNNDKAMQLGQRLFDDNCAACHGYDAKGNQVVGAPDLVDNTWLYGGSVKKVHQSITHGRNGVMPAWKGQLRYGQIKNVANYVLSLSGAPHDSGAAAAGKKIFDTDCTVCHGADAKGNQMMGAVNLTDDIWKWGGSLEDVVTTITDGRNGHMPAWGNRLSKRQIKVIEAWVFSHDNTKEAIAALNE